MLKQWQSMSLIFSRILSDRILTQPKKLYQRNLYQFLHHFHVFPLKFKQVFTYQESVKVAESKFNERPASSFQTKRTNDKFPPRGLIYIKCHVVTINQSAHIFIWTLQTITFPARTKSASTQTTDILDISNWLYFSKYTQL